MRQVSQCSISDRDSDVCASLVSVQPAGYAQGGVESGRQHAEGVHAEGLLADRPMAEPGGTEEPVWKRFSPECVEAARCQARTWLGKGRGGQCTRQRLPDFDLCKMHRKKEVGGERGWLGRVTGAIPEGKLHEFEVALRSAQGKSAGGGRVQRAGFTASRDEDAVQGALKITGRSSAAGRRPAPAASARELVLESAQGRAEAPAELRGVTDEGAPGALQRGRPRRQGWSVLPQAPRSTVHDMSEFRAEDQFVAAEMERRGFQRVDYGSGLQWVGGVALPGDPEDDRQLEAFLRRQYQDMRLQEREAALGRGHRLGRGSD